MERLLGLAYHLKEQGPSASELAFLGDAVYELLVREWLVSSSAGRIGDLHKRKVDLVNSKAQYTAVETLSPQLTEEEKGVFKRGRNADTGHVPKNTDRMHYSYATGLETLFGYLYLKGEIERIRELFFMIVETEK